MKKSKFLSVIALSVAMFFFFTINSFADGAGNCLDLDGIDDYAHGSGISTLIASALSAHAWIRNTVTSPLMLMYGAGTGIDLERKCQKIQPTP